MTIAITGASGALGRATAELVLASTDPQQVVLTTRHPDQLAELSSRGADVRRADFDDSSTLDAAFRGVDRLLLVSTDAVGARLRQQRAAIEAAVRAGVTHVAYTSIPEPVAANPSLVIPDHAGTEAALRESGLAWTMLRNNLYAHMQVPTVQHAAESGRLVSNAGVGAVAYVTRDDCAAVAAAVLTQDGHENEAYNVTGPEALRAVDLAALASRIAGHDVELVAVDDETFATSLRDGGLPAPVADLMVSFGAAARRGFLDSTTPVVHELTGRQPTALADVVSGAVPVS